MQEAKLKMIGHVLIKDDTTGEVLVDQNNAIHFENMSLALANGLGRKPDGGIKNMLFGNGAATISGIGTITYLEPNTVGASATLYNQTFLKLVDDLNTNNIDPSRNRIDISHATGNLFSDVIISAILDTGEPAGQEAFDSTTDSESDFVFDELGLEDYSGNLITHLIFSPVQKSLNRIISISYTIRIQLV